MYKSIFNYLKIYFKHDLNFSCIKSNFKALIFKEDLCKDYGNGNPKKESFLRGGKLRMISISKKNKEYLKEVNTQKRKTSWQ